MSTDTQRTDAFGSMPVADVLQECNLAANVYAALSKLLQGWSSLSADIESENARLREERDENARWRQNLADKLHDTERELAKAKREYAILFDKTQGTPCEQIRHQQEKEDLQRKLIQERLKGREPTRNNGPFYGED